MKDKSINSSTDDKRFYVYEVIDLDLPEDRNIIWRSITTQNKRLSLKVSRETPRGIKSGVGQS